MTHVIKVRPCRSKSRRRLEKAMAPTAAPNNTHDDQVSGPRFQVGQILQNQWRVESLLSKGSFGVVYEAVDVTGSNTRMAVKTEPIVTKLPLLRLELAVMIAVQGKSTHVATLLSAGHTHELNYIVMSLLGKTLMELKKSTSEDRFNITTVLRVGKQMLESLSDLHSCGFLHRDVKPSNFAIEHSMNGSVNRGLVYIFDFGLCRQYINPENGHIRDARVNVPFRGTVRYASIDVLSGKDMGRHDDLWSLFYVLSEMLNSQLPWRRMVEKEKVKSVKQSALPSHLWRSFPPETWAFVQHLQTLHFYDTPNYQLMINCFDLAMHSLKVTEHTPFDWEKQEEKAKEEHVDGGDDDRSLASGKSAEV